MKEKSFQLMMFGCFCAVAIIGAVVWLNPLHQNNLEAAEAIEPTPLFLIRQTVETNVVPGYWGSSSPPQAVGADAMMPRIHVSHADLVAHPPTTNVVTNYVIGYRTKEGVVEIGRVTR